MSILLVTHCYAKLLPQYASFLQYQLSSLVLHKPAVRTRIVVCFTPSDMKTVSVLRWFLETTKPDDLCLTLMALDESELFRRSVGRDKAAMQSEEELIWYTDVDHMFRDECLDKLWEMWTTTDWTQFDERKRHVSILFSKHIQISKDWKSGDAYVAVADENPNQLLDVDPKDFSTKTYYKAIGGVQIVPGTLARRIGYLHGHRRWCVGRKDGKPFADFSDDVLFRYVAVNNGPIKSIHLPGVYRLRHSRKTYE